MDDHQWELHLYVQEHGKKQCTKETPAPSPEEIGDDYWVWEHPDRYAETPGWCCSTWICPHCDERSQSCGGPW